MSAVARPPRPAIAPNMGPPPGRTSPSTETPFGYVYEPLSQYQQRQPQPHRPLQRLQPQGVQYPHHGLHMSSQSQRRNRNRSAAGWSDQQIQYAQPDLGVHDQGWQQTQAPQSSDGPPRPPPLLSPSDTPILTPGEFDSTYNLLGSVYDKDLDRMTSDEHGMHANFGEGVNPGDFPSNLAPTVLSLGSSFGVPGTTPLSSDFLNIQGSSTASLNHFFSGMSGTSVAPSQLQVTVGPIMSDDYVSTSPPNFTLLYTSAASRATDFPPEYLSYPAPPPFTFPQPGTVASVSPVGTTSCVADTSMASPDRQVIGAALALTSRTAMDPPKGPLRRHQNELEFHEDQRRNSSGFFQEQNTMMIGGWFPPTGARQPPPKEHPGLQYGSDPSFSNKEQPFKPRNEYESLEALSSEQDRALKGAIQQSDSVGSTRQSSPVVVAPPELRTKGRPSVGHQEPPSVVLAKTTARKRKADAAESPVTGGSENGGKTTKRRRRSATGNAKKPNLNEQQKRQNHIESERRRRDIIGVGFANLTSMVPALQENSTNKAGMLHGAYSFLKAMKEGNAHLRALLGDTSGP